MKTDRRYSSGSAEVGKGKPLSAEPRAREKGSAEVGKGKPLSAEPRAREKGSAEVGEGESGARGVLRLSVCLAAGALLSVAVFFLELGRLPAAVAAADGLFIGGVLLSSVYALVRVRSAGLFDALGFSLSLLLPRSRRRARDLAEYKRQRRHRSPSAALLWSGLAYLLLSLPLSLLAA